MYLTLASVVAARSNAHATQRSVLFAIGRRAFEEALLEINPMLKWNDTLDGRVLAFIELVSPSKRVKLNHGETLSGPEPALYIVKTGSLKVAKGVEIKEGACFGAEALLSADPSKAKALPVQAASPSTEVVVITAGDFHRLCARSQMVDKYMRELVR